MRNTVLTIAGWAGVLQAITPPVATTDSAARLIGIASVLGTLTVLVYRLGVWRQEMENTKQNAVSQVKASFEQIERRLDAIEHVLADTGERRRRLERWKVRTSRRLERLEATEPAE